MERLKDMDNISTHTVALLLGKSEQYVRIGLQQQRLPIGSAVKMSTQWTYHISYELLKNYVGIEKIMDFEKNMQAI